MTDVLLTPGPLSTSKRVKQACLEDIPSRDQKLVSIMKNIENKLFSLCKINPSRYAFIPLQGSGTYSIEAVVSSTSNASSKWLVLVNGAYGERIAQLLKIHHIEYDLLTYPYNQAVKETDVEARLSKDPTITHVALIHCETTTGLINDIESIGKIVKKYNKTLVIDAMSSLGGIEIDIEAVGADYLISSPNKCFSGIPGFGFVIAKQTTLLNHRGRSKTLVLDLMDQWQVLQDTGQFRFTPPVQSLAAFEIALDELELEGGIACRNERYWQNHQCLLDGMQKVGFTTYLTPEQQGPIITTFNCPDHHGFSFNAFYLALKNQEFIIYPGKVPGLNGFRIGTIGHIYPKDIQQFLKVVKSLIPLIP